MVNVIGDSSSGKTILVLTSFAETAKRKAFNNHRLIYDDSEEANGFDVPRMFGDDLDERMESPQEDDEGHPKYSDSIQDFLLNVDEAIKEPCIYVEDSFDALTTDEDGQVVEALAKERRTGKKQAGSYAMQKPKIASMMFRKICHSLASSDSILIVLSQTRDKIGAGMFESKKTRAGGKALKFYSSHEMWVSIKETLKKSGFPIGILCQVKVSKNKLTGKVRVVDFPIYYDYGVDDITSMIDFLLDQKWWKISGKNITTAHFDGFSGSKQEITQKAEEDDTFHKLLIWNTWQAWEAREEGLRLNRKRRFI